MGYIISLFNKIINFLFGNLRIFAVILGWVLIISGIIFLIRPEKARNNMLGQGFGIVKGFLLVIAIYLALGLMAWGSKFAGIWSILGFLAGLAVIIAFFRIKKKTYVKLQEQFKKVPVHILRIYSVIQIIIGILMVVLKHRIL